MNLDHLKIHGWDERRELLIPGDQETTLDMATRHFVLCCHQAIENHGKFFVALSGGSTPKAIYERITSSPYKDQIPWKKVYLFWSDERSFPPDHEESNYKMAMEAGLARMPIPKEQIFRMVAEKNIEENALAYEQKIKEILMGTPFDLVMLGMGEDGHTASLFPHTEGLHVAGRLAVANYVPQKNTWRMTLTFEAINGADQIAIYVMGTSKKETLKEVLTSQEQFDRYPVQKIGTKKNKALWIVDEAAASALPIN